MKSYIIQITIIAILFAANTVAVQAQRTTDANITGHVLNKRTQEHLPFVSIAVKGTTVGAITDATGHFRIINAPVGTFTITASYIGYESQEIEINLERGRTIEVNFELTESAFLLDQVVVSASKSEVNRKEAVSVVSVFTPKIFEVTNSAFLADGLNFQPGLRIENSCQNCGFPQLRINGLEGPYTQILIDSRPINSALAGVYGLEHIPVNMVDRVEVVRGGGSALFGSSAVAGAVNIITKEPLTSSFSVSNTSNFIYGNTPDIVTNLNASIVSDNYRSGVTLFGSSRNRDPFFHYADEDKEFSHIGKIDLKSIGFRGYYKLNHNHKLTFEYHAIDEFRRGGNNFGRPPHEADIAEQTNHIIHSGGLKYDIFFKDPKHALQIYSSAQTIDRESYYGTGQDPNAYGNTQDLSLTSGSQYTYRANNLLFMPATFIGGVEYSHNALKDEMVGYNRVIDQKIGIYSVFAQNEWRNQTASILLGGRLDKHTMIDNLVFSPRISARYAPKSWLNLRGSYSGGYRGPQAYDEDLHVTAVGGGVSLITLADDLKPEKSQSVTFSSEFSKVSPKASFLFLAEGFYTKLDNVFVLEIESGSEEDGNLHLVRQNGSGAVVAGVNMEANLATLTGFQINSGFTLQSSLYNEEEEWSETAEPQREMFRSPKTYGYITVSGTAWRNLDLSLSGTYTGSMYVQRFAGFVKEDEAFKTPAFFDLSGRIAYNFRLGDNVALQLSGGIKNIFNSFQKEFDRGEDRDAGFLYGPTLPRTIFFGVKLSL